MCGGVQMDLYGETSVVVLYAVDEVACIGLHGADRLGSNSMLEACIFAQRAVKPAINYVQKMAGLHQLINEKKEWPRAYAPTSLKNNVLREILEFIASKMKIMQGIICDFVGLICSTERLKITQRKLCELELDWKEEIFIKGRQPNMVHVRICELRNLFLVANLVIISSALARQDSGIALCHRLPGPCGE